MHSYRLERSTNISPQAQAGTVLDPSDINAVKINVDDVEVVDLSPEEETSDMLTLDVFFRVDNLTDKTLTITNMVVDYISITPGRLAKFLEDDKVSVLEQVLLNATKESKAKAGVSEFNELRKAYKQPLPFKNSIFPTKV